MRCDHSDIRLPPIVPVDLTEDQRSLFDRIRVFIERQDRGFITECDDGAMIGPYNALLHFPQFGHAVWDAVEALTRHSTLPRRVREVAILVTAARYSARYEIYAHELAGAKAGLSASKIASLVTGARPDDLDADESIGYSVAASLTGGGQLPESQYQAAIDTFGEQGTAELLYLVGAYCLVSVLLNGYDVPVPADRVTAAPQPRWSASHAPRCE